MGLECPFLKMTWAIMFFAVKTAFDVEIINVSEKSIGKILIKEK